MLLVTCLQLVAAWVTAVSGVELLDHHEVTRIGCFNDSAARRDLPYGLHHDSENTPQTCLFYCRSWAFYYAGLQAAGWCGCGNTYGSQGAAKDSDCSDKCLGGDGTQTCGGGFKNEVFNTGIYPSGSAVNLKVNAALRKHLHSLESNGLVQRFGCYKDKAAPEADLPHEAVKSGLMSLYICVDHCRAKAFKYAGLQGGNGCSCGNTYGRHGHLEDAKCHVACAGDSSVTCGAQRRNEIYSTGIYPSGSPINQLANVDLRKSFFDRVDGRVQRFGCYQAVSTAAAMAVLGTPVSNSPSACVSLCRSIAFRFAGLHAGGQCLCGNGFSQVGRLEDTNCQLPCPGDASVTCGGAAETEVFSTGITSPGFISSPPDPKTQSGDGAAGLDPTAVRYRGCYAYNYSDTLVIPTGESTSPQLCVSVCRGRSFQFGGLHGGNTCICSRLLPGGDRLVSGTSCGVKCPGDPSVTCGNASAVEVYSTGVAGATTPEAAGAIDIESTAILFDADGGRNLIFLPIGITGTKQAVSPLVDGRAQYLGCYVDTAESDLPRNLSDVEQMTPQFCVDQCRSLAYHYAGVQANGFCYCGNSYGRYGMAASDGECSFACPADSGKKCGAMLRNSVYSTGIFPPGSIMSTMTTFDPTVVKGLIKTNKAVQLLGCYKDQEAYKDQLLDKELPVSVQDERLNSPSFCISFCRSMAYSVAAVRSNSSCSCGHSIGVQPRVSDKECKAPCPGDNSTTCGGVGAKQLYTTGIYTSGSAGKTGNVSEVKSHWLKDGRVRHLGCFDDAVKRDLPYILLPSRGQANQQFCVDMCRSMAYRVAGIQATAFCTCGNTYGMYSQRNDSDCSLPCSGNPNLRCGGNFKNELFSTGIFPPGSRLSNALSAEGENFFRPVDIDGRVQRLGCFAAVSDFEGPARTLEFKALVRTSPQFCVSLCRSLVYKFCGIQAASSCRCFNAYPAGARANDSSCGLKCPADSSVTCGGESSSEVYSTGLSGGVDHVDGIDRDISPLRDDNRVQRLGCFKVKLADLNFILFGNETSPQLCVGYCRSRGYRQTALSNGVWCACANSAHMQAGFVSSSSTSSKLGDSECSVRCRIDANQTCGGPGDNVEIYSTGLYSEEQIIYLDPTVVNVRIGDERVEVGNLWRVQRVACYSEKPGNKTAGLESFFKAGDRASPAFCIDFCRSRAFRFAGLRDGDKCGCGNSYSGYEAVMRTECSLPCPGGNSDVTCGGANKTEVFTTGIMPPGSPNLTLDDFDSRVQRLGCYSENVEPESRDLPLHFNGRSRTSPNYCVNRCRAKGYRFAGLFNGDWCGCGNSYGRYNRADDRDCNLTCTGDASVTCGGAGKSEVYSTGILPPGSMPVYKIKAQLAKTLQEYELDGRVQRFGCYKDTETQRDLTLVIQAGEQASPQFCLNRCRSKAYKYFGLQDSLCTCGNSYGRYKRLRDSKCNVKCKGDVSVTCGTASMNEIYSTGMGTEAK